MFTAAVVVVTATVIFGIVTAQGSGGKAAPAATVQTAQTVVVRRTDLSNAQTVPGTLGYGPALPVTGTGTGTGTVTWLPATGATVVRGHQLYRVDDRPVPLFYGRTPLYRPLTAKGTVGRDVRVVADNLKALGYGIGAQPATGTWVTPAAAPTSGGQDGSASGTASGTASGATSGTASDATGSAPGAPSTPPSPSPSPIRVAKGESVLTSSLTAAIARWQTHVGLPPTGQLAPGDIEVRPGAVRVGSVTAELGDPVTQPVLSVTSTAKKVTVPFDADSLGSIGAGDAVTVTLPDNTTVRGSVSAVSSIVQTASSADGSAPPQLTVTVSISDSPAASRLSSAPVQVSFTSATRKHVLAVPVGALLALSGGGYALQLPGGRLIAITTGMFAKGMVEVTGKGVSEGMRVVTAS